MLSCLLQRFLAGHPASVLYHLCC